MWGVRSCPELLSQTKPLSVVMAALRRHRERVWIARTGRLAVSGAEKCPWTFFVPGAARVTSSLPSEPRDPTGRSEWRDLLELAARFYALPRQGICPVCCEYPGPTSCVLAHTTLETKEAINRKQGGCSSRL